MKNLLVVDMQKGFINQNNIFLVERINTLLKNGNYDIVIYTKFYNKKGSFYETLIDWNGMMNASETDLAVEIFPKSIIFKKQGYGLKNNQIKKIKQLGTTTIDICGTDIDACVLSIMFQLFDNNIQPILLKDYVASSTNKKLEESALNIIINQFGNKCIK